MNVTDCMARDWLGLSWTRWIGETDDTGLRSIPTDPGLYRVRHDAYDGFIYIGETGRSVRGRIRALLRNVTADEMPYSDPHTGAPSLWAIAHRHGGEVELSATAPDIATDSQQRKAIEDAMIALHRREIETNLIGNFGRMPPGYSKSKSRSSGIRGIPDDTATRSFREGVDPLPWENPHALTAANWMGLNWTAPIRLQDITGQVDDTSGVYRIWERDTAPPLEYVGQSVNLKSRLYAHRRNRDQDLVCSYVELPEFDQPFQLLQIEAELLGAHWLACEQAPRDQY